MFGVLMQIAAFDAIPTDDIYDDVVFGPQEGDPINPDFESVGFESIWTIPNLGSLGLYILLLPVFYLMYYMSSVCKQFRAVHTRREKYRKTLFWSILIRMTIESYTITAICCMIGLENIGNSSFYVQLNSWVTIILFVLILIFPVWGYFLMMCNQRRLIFKEEKFGEYWAEMNVSSSVTHFIFFSFLRRLLLAYTVVFLRNNFAFQQIAIISTTMCMLTAYIEIKPYKDHFANKMEAFNEFILLVLAIHIYCFTDWVPDVTWRYRIGFSCTVFIIIGLGGNMLVIIAGSFQLMRRKCR